MNTTFIAKASKKVLAAVLISGAVLVAAPSFAKASSHIEILSANTQASVQFAGTTADNALLFDVKLDNPTAEKFTITISTKDGDVLFAKDFSDKSFVKKFKLLKSDDISSYNFKISSNNKNLEQTFTVDATAKVVDNVTVTKL
jgi:uncharacterized membrane protein YkoI